MRAALLTISAMIAWLAWWSTQVHESEPIVDEGSRIPVAGTTSSDGDRAVVGEDPTPDLQGIRAKRRQKKACGLCV